MFGAVYFGQPYFGQGWSGEVAPVELLAADVAGDSDAIADLSILVILEADVAGDSDAEALLAALVDIEAVASGDATIAGAISLVIIPFRHMLAVDVDGPYRTILECQPFEWPRNLYEVLHIRLTQDKGWHRLDEAKKADLQTLYNNAQGDIRAAVGGYLVQFMNGTGQEPFVVEDWRGNRGLFVFQPNEGLEIDEIHGSDGYHEAHLRLIPVELT